MKAQQPNSGADFYCYGKRIVPPQTSIHPRVVNGRTVHAKVNTAKAPRKPQ